MAIKKTPKILVVDDEEFNVDIIKEYLRVAGFDVVVAFDGDEALQKLEITQGIDVIVLDRMMPKMNGIEVVKFLKKNDRYRHIPVVMQTAAANSAQVLEGIEAGVFYYLTKPYKGDLLVSIVRSALDEGFKIQEIEKRLKSHSDLPNLITSGHFEFRTLEEAKSLAYFLSHSFSDSVSAAFVLTELMINAIEHGNLGITFAEKTKYILDGTHYLEIKKRLELKKNLNKKAELFIENSGDLVKVHIKDQGNGFNWKEFINLSPERVTSPNGRGVAQAKKFFSNIEYLGKGNEVVCIGKSNDSLLNPTPQKNRSSESSGGGFFNKVRQFLQR